MRGPFVAARLTHPSMAPAAEPICAARYRDWSIMPLEPVPGAAPRRTRRAHHLSHSIADPRCTRPPSGGDGGPVQLRADCVLPHPSATQRTSRQRHALVRAAPLPMRREVTPIASGTQLPTPSPKATLPGYPPRPGVAERVEPLHSTPTPVARPASTHTSRSPSTLDRLAFFALACLAATTGLGDLAPATPAAALVLNSVHALLPLVILLTLGNAVRSRRWPRFPRALALPGAVWLAVLVASTIGAARFQTEAVAALMRPVSGLLLAWAVSDLCPTQWRRRWLVHAFGLGGLAVALVAIVEATRLQPLSDWIAVLHNGQILIGDIPRVAATLSHPNEAAMFLELALPLLIALAWTTSPPWRTLWSLAALATLLAVALTFSRAGLVATLTALGVLVLLASRHRAHTQLLLLGVVCLALPLAFVWGFVMDPGLDHRLVAGLEESSVHQPARTVFWAAAVTMLRDHPLLGVGPDNFRWLFATYADVADNNLGIHAHNQYLESLADTGILGFASFSWLMSALVIAAVRRVRRAASDWPWHAALLASLTAWLVHALLDDFERFWPTSVAFWLVVGLILCHPLAGRTADQRLNSQ